MTPAVVINPTLDQIANKQLERAKTVLERCPSRLGEEPGLDIAKNKSQYVTVAGHFNKPALIQAVQYDASSVEAHSYMTIAELVEFVG